MSKIKVEPMLTPGQVAELFHVDPKTVVRWADAGKLTSIRTLGGHRRFKAEEVTRLLGLPTPREPVDDDLTETWRALAAEWVDR